MSYYLQEGIDIMNKKHESRTGNSNYSDPNNANTPREDQKADQEKTRLTNLFFDEFNFMTNEQQYEIADDVMQSSAELIELLTDINSDDYHAIKTVVFNIGIKGARCTSVNTYNLVNKVAKEYIEQQIELNNIFWECE